MLFVTKHKKGCQCKKTSCTKKYCECFRAQILCSENCKCVDCDNKEECEKRLASSLKDHFDTEPCIKRANITSSIAIGLPDSTLPLPSGKRKSQQHLDSNQKDTPIQVFEHPDLANLRFRLVRTFAWLFPLSLNFTEYACTS